MIQAVQLRMARAALGWNLKQLADRAKVHLNTVRRCEAGYEAMSGTLQRIESAFRKEGIIFIEETDESGPGVLLRRGFNSAKPSEVKVGSLRPKKSS